MTAHHPYELNGRNAAIFGGRKCRSLTIRPSHFRAGYFRFYALEVIDEDVEVISRMLAEKFVNPA